MPWAFIDNFDMYWTIGDRLVTNSVYPIRHVPIKVYLPSAAKVVQKLIPPYLPNNRTSPSPTTGHSQTYIANFHRRTNYSRCSSSFDGSRTIPLHASQSYSQTSSTWHCDPAKYPFDWIDEGSELSWWVFACGCGDDVVKTAFFLEARRCVTFGFLSLCFFHWVRSSWDLVLHFSVYCIVFQISLMLWSCVSWDACVVPGGQEYSWW